MLLNSASEAAEACLDMGDGAFFLAWEGELIQDLADKGCCRNVCLTARRLYEVVGVDWTRTDYSKLEPMEKQAWLNLFTKTLMDHIITVGE